MAEQNAVEHEVIEKVPAKAEVVEAVTEALAEPAKKPEPVKTYTQEQVDEITKKVKDNARRKRDEARNEAQALRRILEQNTVRPQPQHQEPAQRQAQEPQTQQPPKREQFQDDNAYFEAVVDYRADLRVQDHLTRQAKQTAEQQERQGQEQLERTFTTNQEKAREKYEDFDDVVYNPSLPPLHPVVIQAIKSLENGPDIAYEIARDPAEAMRIARLHPILALKELGKIEAKLAAPAAPAGTLAVTPAPAARAATRKPLPAPITPVTPRDAKPDSDEPSDSDDDATWLKKRQKQLRENGRR